MRQARRHSQCLASTYPYIGSASQSHKPYTETPNVQK
jgi:hypothetical protein